MSRYSNLTAVTGTLRSNGTVITTLWANATNNNSTTAVQGGFWGLPVTIDSNTTNAIAFCLGSIFILLCCWAIQPSIPTEEHRRAYVLRQRALDRYRRRRERKNKEITPEERMESIEKSLITKRVMDCDSEGNLTLGDAPTEDDLEQQQQQQQSASLADDARSFNSIEAEDDASTCVICLAAFRVGDVVAWSKLNDDCLHVFHRECIDSWLLRPTHSDCPSCRSIILKVEEEETTDDSEGDKPDESDEDGLHDGEPMGEHSERSNHSTSHIFVIMHGLISRARRASYSLIGQNIDTSMSFDDDDECGMELGMMIPPPSPGLRRVVSLGDRSAGSVRLRALSLRRRSLRNSISEHDLALTPSPQLKKPIRVLDRNIALPPLGSTEALKRPMQLRRVVSVDTGSASRRRRLSSSNTSASSSEDNHNPLPHGSSAEGPFLRVMRRAAASTSGAYARIANGDYLDSSERSLDEAEESDGTISQAPSIECPQRSVSWSSDLVMASSQPPPPMRRRRSASYQQASVDEEDEYYNGEEDLLSEEEELQILRAQSLPSERSDRRAGQ